MKKLLAVVLSAVLLSACAMSGHHKLYQGDPAQTTHIDSFDTVLIKYIDNDEMGMSDIGQKQTYDIKAGRHTFLVEYADIFNTGDGNFDKVVSRPAKVTFVAEPGKRYQIQNPLHKQLADAKQFAENPEFFVVELPSKTRVPATVELSRPRSFFQKMSLNKPAYEFASDMVPTSPGAEMPAGAATGAGAQKGEGLSHLKMLQYWWNNASQAERDAFLKWTKQK